MRATAYTLFAMALVLLLSGCSNPRLAAAIDQYQSGDYDAAGTALRPMAEKPDEHYVLNNLRLASVLLAQGRVEEAENPLLKAYEVINSARVNNGGRAAGAVVGHEGLLIWKGEPFERAMANFYLGLVYYSRADYANARGAFENALFKLRDYGEGKIKRDQYREQESGFVLAHLMLGRCFQRLGREDLARANFARVAELSPALAAIADFNVHAASNVLLIIDYGHGPRKDFSYSGVFTVRDKGRLTKATPMDAKFVGFGPTAADAGDLPEPELRLNASTIAIPHRAAATDLLTLAQERRWQDVDTIRKMKGELGEGLLAAAALAASPLLLGAGAAVKAVSQPDVRQWEMLPRATFVLPLNVPPGTHQLSLRFPSVPSAGVMEKAFTVPANGEATVYLRMHPAFKPLPIKWEGPIEADVAAMFPDSLFDVVIENRMSMRTARLHMGERTITLHPGQLTHLWLTRGAHRVQVNLLSEHGTTLNSYRGTVSAGRTARYFVDERAIHSQERHASRTSPARVTRATQFRQ